MTPSNSYNFVAPLTGSSNRTYYWRVGYIRPKNISDPKTWTLLSDSWEASPSVWSATRQFTIAGNAINWDRSMLANETYLSGKSHPYMLFNSNNVASVYDSIKNKSDWTSAKTDAQNILNSSWWPNAKPTTGYIGDWIGHITNAIFVWQMGRNAAAGTPDRVLADKIIASKPQDALALYAQYYLDSKATIVDGITVSEFIGGTKYLAFGYDWLYDVLSASQHQTILRALELRSMCVKNSSFYFWNTTSQYGGCDATGQYNPDSFRVMSSSFFYLGHSHTIDNFYFSMFPALACYKESQACRELFDLGMNYMIGVTQPFNPESGLSEGKGYGSGKLFWGTGDSLYANILASTIFPEARLDLNPFWHNAADAWNRFLPVGQVQGHDPFSDSGWGDLSFGWEGNGWGRDLSYFTGNGEAYTHWQNQLSLDVFAGSRGADNFSSLPIGYYYHAPGSANTSPLSQIFPYDGYAFGCSQPSNSAGCFRDGVGFTFQARPRGSGAGHTPYSDLSFEMWAYGTTFTEGGTQGIDAQYGYHPLQRNSLFVNGLGPVTPALPKQPYYSRIIAYKSTPDYTYVAADGTNAFPTKGTGTYWEYTTPYSQTKSPYNQGKLPFLKKVQRHLLFVHNKYFVIFDDFASDQSGGSTFSWLYNVLENTVTLNKPDASFSYTSNIKKFVDPVLLKNRVDKAAPPDVTVYVKHIEDPSTVKVDDRSGVQVVSNPITGEDFYSAQGVYDKHMRSDSIWVSNITPANKWHFLTVIYPQKPGNSAPTIERIDDYTAKVTANDGTGSVDIISFNPQTAAANGATILVDLSQLTPLPVVDDVTGTTVTSVAYVPPPVNQVIPPVANQVTSPVIPPITPASVSDTTPPVISVSGGTSPLSAGSNSISLSITTNESSTCKWGKTAGTSYASLPNTFATSNGTTHTTSITNLVEGANRIYIRCTDTATPPNANTTDTTVTITVSSPPISTDNDNDGILNTLDKCPNTPTGTTVNQKGCPLPRKTKFSTVTDLSNTDLNTVSSFEVGNTVGKISFTSPVTLIRDNGSLDIDSNLSIKVVWFV